MKLPALEQPKIVVEREYPHVSERIKAVVIDMLILLAFMITAAFALSLFENVPEYVKVSLYIIIFLYDPLFTSFFGGTLGHMMTGIRVKRKSDPEKNIIFPLAVVRFIFKMILGWISLLTVNVNKKRRAMHDYAANSIVVYENSNVQMPGK